MNLAHVRWLILLTVLVNAAAMLSPVINSGDSITYAALSQHIALSGDWANLVLDGQDWLDKPHFPFWLTAVFFKLFGSSAFSYILPGFLFHLVGGYFTYRLARLFYGREAAWLSVLVFVSAYHLMDSSIEVKAETYLTGSIMGACYYWLRYDAQAKLKYLLLGATFSAMAVMTKGVFTLITISSGLVCLWLYRGQWRKLWSGKWLLALGLALLFTAPEIVALYLQFDAHPEKLVFGQTHVSGVKFFIWDSQFGRFFNTGPIKNTQGHPLYFVLVFLWAFLPWVAVFLAAMSTGIRRLLARGSEDGAGFVFLCGAFFVTFGLFSATSFQLDHYTVILFPFAAILCGKFLADWLAVTAAARTLCYVQWSIAGVLVGLVVILSVYTRNVLLMALVCALTLALLGYVYAMRRPVRLGTVTYPLLAINLLFVFLSTLSALTLGKYDVAHNVAQALEGRPPLPVYVQAHQMTLQARELGLYLQQPCVTVDDFALLPPQGGFRVVMQEKNVAEFSRQYPQYTRLASLRLIIQKTGTFPKMLKMAQGNWPLDEIAVLQVP